MEITPKIFPTLDPKVIISNDSLYFFSDIEIKQILRNLSDLLLEQGIIILNYPVLEAFRGTHDLSVGIKKRKNKKELSKLITDNGFEIISSEYWPFFLSPILFFVRTFQKIKLKFSKNVNITSDVDLPPAIINKIFYYLTQSESILPYKPWGSSLFIVARKKSK